MTEQMSSSAPASETAQPAPVAAPPKKDKKKLWLMIVALIVAALLIGTAAFVFVMGGDKELTATIDPDPVTVHAGDSVQVTVEAEWDGDSLTGVTGVKYAWSVDPSDLGDFNLVAQRQVTFTPEGTEGTGTISCTVEYEDKTVVAEVDLTVDPPYLASVNVAGPPSLDPDEPGAYTATAYDSVGAPVSGLTFSWSVWNMTTGDYTLTPSGASATFVASVEGEAWVNASATSEGHTAVGSAKTPITTTVYERSIEYYWYDMFNVPFEDWWYYRSWDQGGDEEILSNTYPYLYIWNGGGDNNWTYTSMRMNVTARNLPEINMTVNPYFFPLMSDTTRGGTAVLDMHVNFEDADTLGEMYNDFVRTWCDGWVTACQGTLTMDRTAAMAILNMTSAEFDDFDTFWAENHLIRSTEYHDWLYDQGNIYYDIYNAYEWSFQILFWEAEQSFVAEKVDSETIVLSLDYATWGMEALYFRWLADAFMNTEWYFENFTIHAEVGPERTDLDINTVVEYAVYAYETTLDGSPCWMWEALVQDILPSTYLYPLSDFDPYEGKTYENLAPGSWLYGTMMQYDYAPGVQNLSAGEMMVIEWPDDPEFLFQDHVEPGLYENITGPMTVDYSEPMWTDSGFEDQIALDLVNRTLTFEGPMDLWTWSRDQTAHANLASEWERLGLLPYGMPTIEFRYAAPPMMDSFLVEGYASPVMAGISSAFEVTAMDQYDDPFPDYIGTVELLTTDTTAVITQSTFDITDPMNGVIVIPSGTVTFNTDGTFELIVRDSVDDTVVGSMEVVVTEAPRLDYFEVVLSAAGDVYAVETLVDVTVTAHDQFGNAYADYVGEITFSSTDEFAWLPLNYTFVVGDAGVHTFVGEILFLTDGDQTVTVNDTSDMTKFGVSDPITVLPMAWPTYILLTDISSTPVINIAETVTATVYDQYDRIFEWYDGTVSFDTNRSGEVTLPADYTFDPMTDMGAHTWTDGVTFTALGLFTVNCTDLDYGAWGELTDIEVVLVPPVISYFIVEGIESMWEGNYSDVTVTAVNDYDNVFSTYEGMIEFTTDATGAYELPADYTFTLTDAGVHTFVAAVMFEEAGTFSVTVADTVVTTATGTQTDIVIGGVPVATTFVLEASDESVPISDLFSVTLTVLDQYGLPCDRYLGTVHFASTDSGATLPADYPFVVGDAGVHVFADELSLSAAGTWTITVTDTVDSALTDSVDMIATEGGWQEIDYTAYDFFEEPFWGWWALRVPAYLTDYVLDNSTGHHTMAFRAYPNGVPAKYQQMMYAPYRWSVDASNFTTAVDGFPAVNTDNPLFMPRFGPSGVTGTDAEFDIYFQYLYQGWWDDYWVSTWDGEAGFDPTFYPGANDGYFLGTVYNVTMNREAAYALLGMPVADNVATWWAANGDTFVTDWEAWIDDQGNNVYDIYCGYEWTLDSFGAWAKLTDIGGGQVKLELAQVSWGYEVLMVRWLTASGLCTHENWYEDFQMYATMDSAMTNLTLDGVVQYQLHAVAQNATEGPESAWVFEAMDIDYITSGDHPSDYEAYSALTYSSWNALDAYDGGSTLGFPISYEAAPGKLNLDNHMTLTFQLPTASNVIAYEGVGLTWTEYNTVWKTGTGNYSDWMHTGPMTLGYNTLDISTGTGSYSYNAGTKTLVVTGPLDFSSTWVRPDGTSYHGAPWIEFDVDWTKLASTAGEPAPLTASSESVAGASAEVSTTSELSSLVSVMCAVMLVTAALALSIGRRRDL